MTIGGRLSRVAEAQRCSDQGRLNQPHDTCLKHKRSPG